MENNNLDCLLDRITPIDTLPDEQEAVDLAGYQVTKAELSPL